MSWPPAPFWKAPPFPRLDGWMALGWEMGSARNGPEGRKEDRPNQRYSEWVDWEDVFFWMLMVVRNSFEVLFWWYWLYMKKERRDWTGYASRGQAYIVESYWHLIIADTTVIMLSTFHNAWSKLRQSEVVQTDPQTMADTAILAQESAILAQERVEVILLWDTWCIFLFPSCWNWNTVDVRNPAPPGMYKTLLKSGKKTSYSSTGSPENLPSPVGCSWEVHVMRMQQAKTKEAKEQYQIVPWCQLSWGGIFRSIHCKHPQLLIPSWDPMKRFLLIQTTNINLQDYDILLLLDFRSEDNFEYFDFNISFRSISALYVISGVLFGWNYAITWMSWGDGRRGGVASLCCEHHPWGGRATDGCAVDFPPTHWHLGHVGCHFAK